MLRQVVSKSTLSLARRLAAQPKPKLSQQQQRGYAAATSREKRALNKKQLEGEKAAPSSAAPKAVASGGDASAAPPAGGDGGGSNLPAIVGVVAIAGAGAAYAFDLIPGMGGGAEEETAPVVAETPKKEEKEETVESSPPVEVKKEEAPVVEEKVAEAPKKEEEEAPPAPSASDVGNRVMNITLPKGSSYSEPPAAITDHPFGGNKVAMKPPSSDGDNAATVDAALAELQSDLAKETSKALSEAHQELAKLVSLDLSELDEMTPAQLKIRLIQMAKDLEERTKWEAVRLKEFLAMKEKEVEDKHVLLMKKQVMEAETTMEQRLREQKSDLTSKAEATLKEKTDALQELIDSSLKIQEQAYNDEKAQFEKQTEEAISAKYEELYGKTLQEAKESFSNKLEQRTTLMEALTKKLNELEIALQTSKDFQSDSVQAHRMSAALIALIDRLESAQPAGAAMNALKAIASDNLVVSSALESLPDVVSNQGVASLQELQTNFEESVFKKCRQAANVPEGTVGVEGQLVGMLLSTVKFPPGPEDAAPSDEEKDNAEYVLARARRHVQLGELELAAQQMDKLTGQVAFTARDWTQRVKDKIAVDKVLKVIRMECALANDTMGKAA